MFIAPIVVEGVVDWVKTLSDTEPIPPPTGTTTPESSDPNGDEDTSEPDGTGTTPPTTTPSPPTGTTTPESSDSPAADDGAADDEEPVQTALDYCSAWIGFGFFNSNGQEIGEVVRYVNGRGTHSIQGTQAWATETCQAVLPAQER